MAIDIANRDTGKTTEAKDLYERFSRLDEDKLKWAFRLYDMDNNGGINIEEMRNIIETLDCIEGVKPGMFETFYCHARVT